MPNCFADQTLAPISDPLELLSISIGVVIWLSVGYWLIRRIGGSEPETIVAALNVTVGGLICCGVASAILYPIAVFVLDSRPIDDALQTSFLVVPLCTTAVIAIITLTFNVRLNRALLRRLKAGRTVENQASAQRVRWWLTRLRVIHAPLFRLRGTTIDHVLATALGAGR